MTDYGVTPTGFVKKTLQIIKTEIQDDLKDLISPKLNFLDSSRFGQLTGVWGDKLRELWDVGEALWAAMYPDSASAASLDQVSSITGAIRLGETKSEITLDQLFLNDGVTVTVGSIVQIGSTGARWATTTEVSNATGAKGTFSTTAESENAGEIIGYAKTIDEIVTPISGWSAACALTCSSSENYTLDGKALTLKIDQGSVQTVNFSGGDPWSAADAASEIVSQTTDLTASDEGGKVRIFSLFEGEGSAVEITGGTANAAFGFSTDEIKGFNSGDATLGREIETDPEFRLRRVELLRQIGNGTVEAIRAKIRALAGIVQAIVIENVELTTSPEGLPGKSFESVAHQVAWTSAEEQEVADTIWATKPAGIEAHGDISKTVTDSMGFTHTIKFSKPTPVPIYIDCTITVDPAIYPTDGDAQVKAALKAKGDEQQVGEDVIALQFKCVPLDVAGVIDVTIFKIDTDDTPPMGSDNIVIAYNELSTFDTGNIDVTSS